MPRVFLKACVDGSLGHHKHPVKCLISWQFAPARPLAPDSFDHREPTKQVYWERAHKPTPYWPPGIERRIQSMVDKVGRPQYEGERFMVLDLMSGRYSYVPAGIPKHVTIVGRNQKELDKDTLANATRAQDLNASPKLLETSHSQDMVVIVSGVQFLGNPLALFKEIHRVLQPGKPVLIAWAANYTPFGHTKNRPLYLLVLAA